MHRNGFPGPCVKCGRNVRKGCGRPVGRDERGRWMIQHLDCSTYESRRSSTERITVRRAAVP